MATTVVLNQATLTVDSVDFSDQCSSITVTESYEALESTAFGDTARKFVKDWMLENRINQPSFKAMRAKCDSHDMEVVGKKLRDMMPWIAERKMVDKAKN